MRPADRRGRWERNRTPLVKQRCPWRDRCQSVLVSAIQELINLGRFRSRGLGVELLEPRRVADMIPGRALALSVQGGSTTKGSRKRRFNSATASRQAPPPAKPTGGLLNDRLNIPFREATVVESARTEGTRVQEVVLDLVYRESVRAKLNLFTVAPLKRTVERAKTRPLHPQGAIPT